MDWIDLGWISLRYDVRGEGQSTLVLIHEMGGTLESWDQVVPAVANTRRVVRFDTRGAGLSEKIVGAVTWDEMADDVRALLDALHIGGKVALAGIAVGAGIAVHFAAQYPERTVALVLHGPATGVTGERRQATLDRAAAVETGGMRGAVESSLALSYPPVVRHDPAVFETFRARWLANDPRSFAAINRMLAEADISGDLERIACPTLVTAGTHDGLRPPAMIEPLSKRILGAEFLELNTGHFAALQTPGLVSQAIHSFLWSHGV